MTETQYHLLKTRRFLPLFVTQFFNAFNDNVFKNAFVILITYKISQSESYEQFMISVIGGVFILPFFLFSATAGQIADKYEKSRLIRIIKTAEIFIMVIASIGFYFNNLTLLLTTLFLLGTHSTFFGPIKYSILPEHLYRSELIGGNALIEAGTFVAILIGQILGGSLILGPNGITFISIALLSISLLGLSSSLFIPTTKRAAPNITVSFNIIRETWRIIKLTSQKRINLIAILGISWFWFIGATFITQFPTFVKEYLHSSASIFTLFLTTFSLGIGIGSLLCNTLLKGKITAKYVPYAILAMSLFIIDIYLSSKQIRQTPTHLLSLSEFLIRPNNIRILLDILLLTISGGLFVVPLYALLQESSDESIRSRVIACNNIINAIFMVGSSLFIIFFTGWGFKLRHLFLIVALCNLFIAVFIYVFLPEEAYKNK